MKRPREPPDIDRSDRFQRGGASMTKSEKKAVIESMAERFMGIDDLEGKSMTIMIMSAYTEGKAAGKAEERRRWEQEREGIATA